MTTLTPAVQAHTTGPWRLEPPRRDLWWRVLGIGHEYDALAIVFLKVDAALIAAAPEMYAALKAMLDPDAEGDVELAMAAIAKAEGRSEP